MNDDHDDEDSTFPLSPQVVRRALAGVPGVVETEAGERLAVVDGSQLAILLTAAIGVVHRCEGAIWSAWIEDFPEVSGQGETQADAARDLARAVAGTETTTDARWPAWALGLIARLLTEQQLYPWLSSAMMF